MQLSERSEVTHKNRYHTQILKDRRNSLQVDFSLIPSTFTAASALILAIAKARSDSFNILVVRGSSGIINSRQMPIPMVMMPMEETMKDIREDRGVLLPSTKKI
jgi:hypothetical protein